MDKQDEPKKAGKILAVVTVTIVISIIYLMFGTLNPVVVWNALISMAIIFGACALLILAYAKTFPKMEVADLH